ncbi:MAG: hypothetical protein FWB80_12515 [Defluviitaleaceae bacterium]|nr:hypothetical protein [Defluviitaleaceae bacterium]
MSKKKPVLALSSVFIIISVVFLLLYNINKSYDFNINIEAVEFFDNDIKTHYNFEDEFLLLEIMHVVEPRFSYFMLSNMYNRLSNEFSLPMLFYYLQFQQNIFQLEINDELIPRINEFIKRRIREIEADEVLQLRFSNEELYFLAKIDFWIDNSDNLDFYISTIYELIRLEKSANGYFDIFELTVLLRVLDTVGYFSENLENFFYDRLLYLLSNTEYFKEDTTEIGLTGLEILYASIIFNRISDYNMDIDLSHKKFWYSNQVDNMNRLLVNTDINLMILSSIVAVIMQPLNSYFSVAFDEYAYNHFINRIKDIDFNEIFFHSYSFTYSGLYLLKSENMQYVDSYILNAINFGNLVALRANFSDIREQFFGLLIARNLDFDIDESIFMNYINSINLRDIHEAYYFMMIAENLNSSIEEIRRYDILRLIDNGFSQILRLDPISIHHMIAIGVLLDRPLLDDEFEKIVYAIESFDVEYFTDEQFFFYVLLRDVLNLDIDKVWLALNIGEYYTGEGAFSIVKHNSEGANIMSTFRMLRLIERYNVNLSLNIDDIFEALNRHRGIYGGYFFVNPYVHGTTLVENYRDNFSFESWFSGLFLYDFLHRFQNI